MKRSRYRDTQIIAILNEQGDAAQKPFAEAMLEILVLSFAEGGGVEGHHGKTACLEPIEGW